MCSFFENVLRKFVHPCLGTARIPVVEQQAQIDKMKLRWSHVRETKGSAAKGSGDLGFVSLIGLIQALIFVVGGETCMKLDFLACSPHLHTDGGFVHG